MKRICFILIATLIAATVIHGIATQSIHEPLRRNVLEDQLGKNLVKMLSTYLVLKYVSLRFSKNVEGAAVTTLLLKFPPIVVGRGWTYANVSIDYIYVAPLLEEERKGSKKEIVVRRGDLHNESLTIFADDNEVVIRRSLSQHRLTHVVMDTTYREVFDGDRVTHAEERFVVKILSANKTFSHAMYVDYSRNGIVKRMKLVWSAMAVTVDVDLDSDTISVSIGSDKHLLNDDDTRRFVEILKNLPKHIAVKYLNSSVTKIGGTTLLLHTFEILIDVPFEGSNVTMVLFENLTTTFVDIAGIVLLPYREHLNLAMARIEIGNLSLEAKVSNYDIETKIVRIELQP